MSTKRDRPHLKTYFETGDRPTEGEFIELMDSLIVQEEDEIWVDTNDPMKKVGIGTKDPKKKLDVNGNVHVRDNITVEGHISGDKSNITSSNDDVLLITNGAGLQLHGKQYPTREGDLYLYGDKSDNGSGKIVFSQRLGIGSWRNNMVINTDGNVGIGTASPEQKLDIDGNLKVRGRISGDHKSNAFTIAVDDEATKNQPSISLYGVDASGQYVEPGQLRFNAGDGAGESGGFTFIQHMPNAIGTKWPTLMKIKKNGNVGIGTHDPQNKLVVDNGAVITGTEDTGLKLPTNAGEDKILASDNLGNAKWVDKTSVTDGLWIKDDTTQDIRNGNTGKVFIGSSPSLNPDPSNVSLLEINAGSGRGLSINTANNDVINFYDPTVYSPSNPSVPFTFVDHADRGFRFYNANASQAKFTMKASGSVGIGTTNITEFLTVAGSIGVRGDITNRYSDDLRISSAPSNDGAWMTMYSKDHSTNKGSFNFVTRNNGTDPDNGTNAFVFKNYRPNASSQVYKDLLSINREEANFGGNIKVKGNSIFEKRKYTIYGYELSTDGSSMLYNTKDTNYSTIDYHAVVISTEMYDFAIPNTHGTTIDNDDHLKQYFKVSPDQGENWKFYCHAPTTSHYAKKKHSYKDVRYVIHVLYMRKELTGSFEY